MADNQDMRIHCAYDELKDIAGERWLPISGYENRYLVSDFGRVASIAFYDINYGWKSKWQIINPRLHDNRCHVVNLWRDNKFKTFRVHRLVATAFLDNPDSKKTINHIDGDPQNNQLQNLEWATQSENNLHSYRSLGRTGSFVGRCGNKHPNSNRVGRVVSGKVIEEFESARQASLAYGLADSSVAKSARTGCKAGEMEWVYL
jgi:hypothetical protein